MTMAAANFNVTLDVRAYVEGMEHAAALTRALGRKRYSSKRAARIVKRSRGTH